jgi:predicted ATPase
VFPATFDLVSATALLVDDEVDAADVLDILANLTAKSLLLTQASGERTLYRFLETSRAYALEKLQCSQDTTEIRRRQAHLQFKCETENCSLATSLPILTGTEDC